jgi:uncharacterized membrane protein YcaP (DUF421 family)
VWELVSSLVISEVAALPIADPDIPIMNAVIPALLIVCLEIIISYIKNKSSVLKKYVEGEPIYIIFRGKLLQGALRKNRISVNELLSEMRTQGIASLEDVEYALLEPNGSISIFKKDGDRVSHSIIIDGVVDTDALKDINRDDAWLENVLRNKGVSLEEIFIMTVNDDNNIYIIRKETQK